nr:MAG TPA: hypothetical protein [Caudoviricetes sp.]
MIINSKIVGELSCSTNFKKLIIIHLIEIRQVK